jgi:hypothetical protein
MLYIKKIAQMFDIPMDQLSHAHAIFTRMQIDFSECTDEEFEQEAKFAAGRYYDDVTNAIQGS